MLLPLDSPHWNDLTACYSTPRAIELLRQIVSSRRLGEAWREFHDEIIHQGTVYGVTSAALPHLIRLAPSLTPDEQHDLWIAVGFLVTAGAGSFNGQEPVPGMQETLTQSLRDAEPLALQAFLDAETLGPDEASYFALACVALAGHALGDTLWEFLSPGEGYVRLQCRECDAGYEVDGFTDPLRAPCDPPPVPLLAPRARPDWARVPIDLLPGFDAAARAVADVGLPADAPMRAVWCLVAAMVAAKGAVPWARTLLRLTGHFRCGEYQSVLPIASLLRKWRTWPVEDSDPPQHIDPAVIADKAGFKPAPGGTLVPGDFPLHPIAVPDGLHPPVATEVLVVMPDQGGPKKLPWLPGARLKVPWLASVRDGRTLLAVGDATGAVRLCDPSTRTPYGTLFKRPGRPVVGMIFAQADVFRDLVVVYGDLTVDVWSPDAVHGERSDLAPAPDRLHANGHSRIVAVCPGAGLGYRTPILLADRDGIVSMWEPFGVRLSDPLPPDPAHYDVMAVAASAGLRCHGREGEPQSADLAAFVGQGFLGPSVVRPRVADVHRNDPHRRQRRRGGQLLCWRRGRTTAMPDRNLLKCQVRFGNGQNGLALGTFCTSRSRSMAGSIQRTRFDFLSFLYQRPERRRRRGRRNARPRAMGDGERGRTIPLSAGDHQYGCN